jgi:hypothetical protein
MFNLTPYQRIEGVVYTTLFLILFGILHPIVLEKHIVGKQVMVNTILFCIWYYVSKSISNTISYIK